MFNALQPPSLIPYANEVKKTKPLNKPSVIIPITTGRTIIRAEKECPASPKSQFKEWNLPPQPEGYIKGGKFDFL
jgi:hypothetical protein